MNMNNSSTVNPPQVSPQGTPSQESPLDWVKQNVGTKRTTIEQAHPGFVRTGDANGTIVPPPQPQAQPQAQTTAIPPAPQTPAEADAFVQTLMESALPEAPVSEPVAPAPVEETSVEGEEGK